MMDILAQANVQVFLWIRKCEFSVAGMAWRPRLLNQVRASEPFLCLYERILLRPRRMATLDLEEARNTLGCEKPASHLQSLASHVGELGGVGSSSPRAPLLSTVTLPSLPAQAQRVTGSRSAGGV